MFAVDTDRRLRIMYMGTDQLVLRGRLIACIGDRP